MLPNLNGTAITLTYMNGEYTALRSQRVYNKVWGDSGLDPDNRHQYYVFAISGADDKYKSKNGYHAHSLELREGVQLSNENK